MKADKAKIAERLVQLRQGRSIEEEASMLGIPYQTYYAHQNGERGISRSLHVYASKYNVSPTWLLYGSDEAAPAPERIIPVKDREFKRRAVELAELHVKLLKSRPQIQDNAIEAILGILGGHQKEP